VNDESFAPRRHRRRQTGVDASCSDRDGRATGVAVTDLSEAGCRLELEDGAVAPDEVVVVRPQGLEGVAGRVRWSHEKAAGVEFASALHPAVVDHLTGDDDLEGVPQAPRPNSGFTDNFGRPLPTLGGMRRRK